MEAKAWAQEVRAFKNYRSADGSEGVTALEAGIQFKNGLYVGGTFSAAALPLTTNSITINGTAGNGYIQYAAQTSNPSLALVHTFANSGGHFSIGQSGSSANIISFENSLLTSDRLYTFQNKTGTLAMTNDNISEFTNDSGYVVGPASAVSGRIPSFNGTTGKLVQDSGINLSGTSGKSLILTGGLTIGADTSISGGGTVALGGFTLTVPATGTAVLTSRTIAEGAGLAGNTYDLSANRTLAMGTPSTLSIVSTNAASGTTHTHAITASSNPGAAAALLATDASGFLTLKRLTVTDYAFVNAATANLYLKDTSTGFQAATTQIVTLQSGNTLRSSASFTSGVLGWNQTAAGDAEFNNVRIRGELAASVFKVSEISATAGTFGVFYSASSLFLDYTTPASTGSSATFEAKNSDAGGMLFAVGDIVRIKSWTGSGISDAWLEIAARSNNGATTSYFATLRNGSASATFRAGTAIVDYGPSGTGLITLSTDGTVGSSPNLSMATHAGSPWSTQTTLLRFGNMNGSYGYATDVYGLGIGQYGTASKSWLTVEQTNGIRIGNNTTVLGQWDTSGNVLIGQTGASQSNVYITSGGVQFRTNTTVNIQLASSGDVTLGNVATNQANAFWDNTSKQLKFRGSTNGTVVQSYIDTDGSFVAGAGAVTLSSVGLGIGVGQATDFDGTSAVRFTASGTLRASLTAATGLFNQNFVSIMARRSSGASGGNTASNLAVQNSAGTIQGTASVLFDGTNTWFETSVPTSIQGSGSYPTNSFEVTGKGLFTLGYLAPPSSGTAVFAADSSSGSLLSIANNATATPFGAGSFLGGIFVVTGSTVAGDTAVFMVGGGVLTLISQTGTGFSTTATTAAKVNVYLVGSTVTIENKRGATETLNVFAIKTR